MEDWRFLVVDDRQADEIEEFIAGNRVLKAPDRVIVEKCTKFSEALNDLNRKRIDLVILDLRDDSIALEDADTPLAGEEVFKQIKETRFVPIIFYTAYPNKVKAFQNPYVQMVTRGGNGTELRDAIMQIFDTGLPRLIRRLDEEQRKYMWDYVQANWQNYVSSNDRTEVSYLLARRLANLLERSSIRRFLEEQGAEGPREKDQTVYPVEMYVYPPTSPNLLGGDIVKYGSSEQEYWVVITPSCDLEHDKANYVILAKCELLSTQPEFVNVQNSIMEGKRPSANAEGDLKGLICNNRRKVNGKRFQPQRYIFLPETFFLPALVIDFQALSRVSRDEIKDEHRIASLDSPFAEAYLAQFSAYYGRLGTPDIDKDFVYNRIKDSIQKKPHAD